MFTDNVMDTSHLPAEHIPADTKRYPNAALMLSRLRRRWVNIEPTLGECLQFDTMIYYPVNIIITLNKHNVI